MAGDDFFINSNPEHWLRFINCLFLNIFMFILSQFVFMLFLILVFNIIEIMRQLCIFNFDKILFNATKYKGFLEVIKNLLNKVIKNNYATFAAFVINIDFIKEFSMFFKHIDDKAFSKTLDDIRFEFQEHSQVANSKIKDLQHSLDLYEF